MGHRSYAKHMMTRVKIILVLVGVAILATTGWLVYKKQHNGASSSSGSAVLAVDPAFGKLPEGWLTYKNNAKGLRFAYPAVWGMFDPVALRTPQYQDAGRAMTGRLVVQFSDQQSAPSGSQVVQIKGGTALDLGTADASCIYSRWSIPLKSGSAVVATPSFCPQGGLQPDATDSQQDYLQLKNSFLSTVGVY